jgi:hypothetical protein
MGLKMAAP